MASAGGRKPKELRLKRVYEAPQKSDGLRVLVDRLWPRGLSKDKAKVDLWLKDIAPSDDLRHRFHAKPEKWAEFKVAYAKELKEPAAQAAVEQLIEALAGRPVTLLYAARDEEHNNATALRDWLARP
jgi:uncharacterized protein YeaO (DUF488 family)